jgi:hypothetical protein
MKSFALLFLFAGSCFLSCKSQTKSATTSDMTDAATKFLQSLSTDQKQKAQFLFDDEERYNWNFVPIQRKGIPIRELSEAQLNVAMELLKTVLSDSGIKKTTSIMKLETVLKEFEGRDANDDYRDPVKYYFSIFGKPGETIWGWRLEGHHVAFNFSSENNLLISGTPGFLGSNPAVVLSGPQKGLQILKEETEFGLAFMQSLNSSQKEKAIINAKAPTEIFTSNSRKAMINEPKGVLYSELTAEQKKKFLQLLHLYINRYKPSFAKKMMQDIEAADLNKLQFAWAGEEQSGPGHPHYYRIHGPTIIIEYDNTQNNANHVHTVIRDLKNDFGGDQLLEHYKEHKH